MAGNCIFCRIVHSEAPRSLVFEDDLVVGFMDILPVNPGHLLVAPKAHAVHLEDLSEETGAQMMRVGMRLAAAIREALAPDGVNLFLADGRAAGQVVSHSHLHVIPRLQGDGFHLVVDYDQAPDRAMLDEQAGFVRDALGD